MFLGLLGFGLLAVADASAVAPRQTGSCPGPVATPPGFKPNAKWQVDINKPVVLPPRGTALVPDADIWDIDLFHASQNRTIVDELHARGKTVICYFNFGAVQPSDCDFDKWYTPSNSATNLWTGPWYGEVSGNDCYCERYVDFKSDKVLNLLKARIKLAADSGCDGVDPDNIDIDRIPNGVTADQAVKIVQDMADYAHTLSVNMGQTSTPSHKLLFGQKNAGSMAEALVAHADFAVLEQCLQADSDGCSDFQRYVDCGKPVVDIEYPPSLLDANQPGGCNTAGVKGNENGVCKTNAAGATVKAVPDGFSEVLKLDRAAFGLNGCTQYCGSKVEVTRESDAEKACGVTLPSGDKELCRNRCYDDCCSGSGCSSCNKKCTSADDTCPKQTSAKMLFARAF